MNKHRTLIIWSARVQQIETPCAPLAMMRRGSWAATP